MKAAVLKELNRPIVVEDVDFEGPRSGEVLVKVAATGVCHSCYHAVTGKLDVPLPTVLGDEGAGIVEEVGAGVTLVQPGDHVILSWAPSCGHCIYCTQGYPAVCLTASRIQKGYMADGTTRYSTNGEPVYHFANISSFAEYTIIAEESAIPVDEDIPLDKAALVGCSVTTGVCAVTNTARVRPGSSVAVFGVGGIGLNVVQGALLAGAERIIGIDLVDSKLEMAEQLGATHTINAGETDPVEGVHALTDGLRRRVRLRGHRDEGHLRAGGPLDQESRYGCLDRRTAPRAAVPRCRGRLLGREDDHGEQLRLSAAPLRHAAAAGPLQGGTPEARRAGDRTYQLDQINEAFDDMLQGKLARGLIRF